MASRYDILHGKKSLRFSLHQAINALANKPIPFKGQQYEIFFYNQGDEEGHKCNYKTIIRVEDREFFVCACNSSWGFIGEGYDTSNILDRKDPKQWKKSKKELKQNRESALKNPVELEEKELNRLQSFWLPPSTEKYEQPMCRM